MFYPNALRELTFSLPLTPSDVDVVRSLAQITRKLEMHGSAQLQRRKSVVEAIRLKRAGTNRSFKNVIRISASEVLKTLIVSAPAETWLANLQCFPTNCHQWRQEIDCEMPSDFR